MNADQLREIRERRRAFMFATNDISTEDGLAAHHDALELLAEVDRLRALCGRAADAVSPIAHYAAMREAKPCRGLSDVIHAVHTNSEWEAELTLEHVNAVSALLTELRASK